jgi:hypothetical protein
MLDRISKADRISLIGAIVLFIGLFLPWYGIESDFIPDGPAGDLVRSTLESVSANAFEAFDVIDIILLLLAIAAAALIVLIALDKIDASLHRFVETIGGAAAVIVLFRMIFQPDLASLKWGVFVALIGAIAIAAGPVLERMGKV